MTLPRHSISLAFNETASPQSGSGNAVPSIPLSSSNAVMSLFSRLESLISSQYSAEATDPRQYLEQQGIASLSIAILDHGKISSHNISCIGDDTETVFQACSISKVIAAVACLKLVETGKLSLDAPLIDCLPSDVLDILNTDRSKGLVGTITVKQLLTHTSGLTLHGIPGYHGKPPSQTRDVLSGRAPANISQIHLESLPGLFFSYSGGALTVLQAVLETAAEQEYRKLVQDLVFKPLQMTNSFYGSPEPHGFTNFAKAHYTASVACDPPFHNFREDAAAGLWTTPTDLMKLTLALQRSLKPKIDNDAVYLQQSLTRQMLTETMSNKGLIMCCPKHPGTYFGHTGDNDPGYSCVMIGFADLRFSESEKGGEAPDECGFAIMLNAAYPRGPEFYSRVSAAISYLMNWPNTPALCTPGEPVPFAEYAASACPTGWTKWVGTWTGGDSDSITLLERLSGQHKGSPFLRFQELPDLRLVPAAGRPEKSTGEDEVFLFVVEGMHVAVKLVAMHAELRVELRHGATGELKVFSRPT